MADNGPVKWDLDTSAPDLIRALSAVSDGRCPDCAVLLGEFGFCARCGARWAWGCVEGDREPWLEYRSPDWCLSVFWYPFTMAGVHQVRRLPERAGWRSRLLRRAGPGR